MRHLAFLALFAVCGCKSFGTFFSGDAAEPTYTSDAESNLKAGKSALESKNFIEAQKYFDWVKSKYPYLEVATTAELLLADTDFEREKFIEARDRYQTFIKLHPTHAQVDYAAYRAALTHYKEIPSDFFLLPPATEKDQAEVRAAAVAMADFCRTYPSSSHFGEAKKVLDEVRRRLAEHELYVASFYRNRDRWFAVATRLGNVARDYGDLGYEEEVYFGLYDAYSRLKDEEKARGALRTLVARYPDTKGARRAAKVLGDDLKKDVRNKEEEKKEELKQAEPPKAAPG